MSCKRNLILFREYFKQKMLSRNKLFHIYDCEGTVVLTGWSGPPPLLGLRTGTCLTPHKAFSLCTGSWQSPEWSGFLKSILHVTAHTHTHTFLLLTYSATKLTLISTWRSPALFNKKKSGGSKILKGQMETWQGDCETKELFWFTASHAKLINLSAAVALLNLL